MRLEMRWRGRGGGSGDAQRTKEERGGRVDLWKGDVYNTSMCLFSVDDEMLVVRHVDNIQIRGFLANHALSFGFVSPPFSPTFTRERERKAPKRLFSTSYRHSFHIPKEKAPQHHLARSLDAHILDYNSRKKYPRLSDSISEDPPLLKLGICVGTLMLVLVGKKGGVGGGGGGYEMVEGGERGREWRFCSLARE